jgi:NADPH-dependent ferric siderophore reductase
MLLMSVFTCNKAGMASTRAILGELVGKFIFRQGQVASLSEPGPAFRRVCLEGPHLRGVSWTPGDKLQLFLPEHGMRTYTPISWDSARGSTELLIFLHGDSPGAAWGRSVQVGDALHFFGPRRSIDGNGLPEQVVLFGDETSLAVARALRSRFRAQHLTCVFEVSAPHDVQPLLDELELGTSVVVPRRAGDSHLPLVQQALLEQLGRFSAAQLVMTGRAAAIQALRSRLKAAPGNHRVAASKAYWALGKRGLD